MPGMARWVHWRVLPDHVTDHVTLAQKATWQVLRLIEQQGAGGGADCQLRRFVEQTVKASLFALHIELQLAGMCTCMGVSLAVQD